MSTFSDLPRYPSESADADRPADSGSSIRHAATVVQVASEVLFLAMPLVGLLWLLASFPVLLALFVATAQRDELP